MNQSLHLDLEKIKQIHLTCEYKNIYVIGYYGHGNLGDESYKTTFDFMFKSFLPKNDLENYKITYLDCDTIKLNNFNDNDVIILGGGDILNDYFLDKIILKFRNKPNKIIAVSVGVPYIDVVINTHKLNIIDYIFVRTKQDHDLFKEYFYSHRIFYIPDLSYYLLNLPKLKITNPTIDPKTVNILNKLKSIKKDKKIVAITLSRHIKANSNIINENYDCFISSFSKFIKYLLTFNYHVVFLPFNTNQGVSGNHENDIIIHNDIINLIKSSNPTIINSESITNIDFSIDSSVILQLYDYFYVTIPMRFHATLFSIYKCVPMLPIFTTRKIKNLLLDINYKYSFPLNTDEHDLPLDINETILISKFAELINKIDAIQSDLNIANRDLFVKEFKPLFDNNNSTVSLISLITKDYSKINTMNIISTMDFKIQDAYNKALRLATDHGYNHFTDITNDKLQDICVQIISYTLTNGTLNSIYNYGLKQKLFLKENNIFKTCYNIETQLHKEWKWIINDNIKKRYLRQKLYNNPYGLFNINYIDQIDYSGVHRSGWQYVYENINYLHNENVDLYMDLYLDRTFHWNKEVNKFLGLIPYKKNWMGFIHHTFETGFSDYNCYNLLDNDDFIESLKLCKCIFVLSNDLRIKFQKEFFKKNICVPVFALTHPTEIKNIPLWNYDSFINNKDKKLINVGAWLRNIFSFYYLNLPAQYTFVYKKNIFQKIKTTDNIRKVCLKGGHMNNYFPSLNFTNNISQFLILEENNQFSINSNALQNISQNTSQNTSQNISQNTSQNISQNTSQNISQNTSQNISQNTSQNISQNTCLQQNILNTTLHNPLHNSSQSVSQNVSQNVPQNNGLLNNWYRHFHNYIRNMINSVDIINQLTNDQYDELLTKNIVFINVVDASGINTVIECIVRNTPILVNNHPAVVEMLGKNYPLYFTSGASLYEINNEIVTLLSRPTIIQKTNIYLQRLNKTKYTIRYFIKQMSNIIKNI